MRAENRIEPNSKGTEEYITVFDEELLVGICDEEFVIQSGDSIRFKRIDHMTISITDRYSRT
jgi:hypothetical protein